jgi:hypothetical protein
MEYEFLILHWMVRRQLYVIQFLGGDVDWDSVAN